jgi:hypothetical protein
LLLSFLITAHAQTLAARWSEKEQRNGKAGSPGIAALIIYLPVPSNGDKKFRYRMSSFV